MDDYIKRSEAVAAFANYLGATSKRAAIAVACILKPIPAADVRENVRGKWIHWARSDECSVCGYNTGKYEMGSNFCPNCGADMRGEMDV